MVSITLFFFVGGAAAALMRLELLTPQGDLVTSATYNKLFTIHGTVMVWFFLIPSIPTVLGNFLVPLMIGARDVAFPRLNLASWYLFMAGGAFALWSILAGGVDTGWTFYTPYSSTYANGHVIAMTAGIFIAGFGSIATGLNFIVTIHKMRAPGLTWFRLPLFIWGIYTTSIILVLATPVLAITLALMALERVFGVGIFNPAMGGDPLLFQHLFWFYSHPAVYIMILPGMGCRQRIDPVLRAQIHVRLPLRRLCHRGDRRVWISGLGPSHVRVQPVDLRRNDFFNPKLPGVHSFGHQGLQLDSHTLQRVRSHFQRRCSMRLGLSDCSPIGGMTGLFLAALAVDVHLHDTYFVIAHFHYIMVGGMVMAYLGGLHFWWPKISGRMYCEWLAKLSAATIFLGSISRFSRSLFLAFSACRGAIPFTRRSSRFLTCSRLRALQFSPSAISCRSRICCGHCAMENGRARIHGRQPAWNGQPRRHRRVTISRPRLS